MRSQKPKWRKTSKALILQIGQYKLEVRPFNSLHQVTGLIHLDPTAIGRQIITTSPHYSCIGNTEKDVKQRLIGVLREIAMEDVSHMIQALSDDDLLKIGLRRTKEA
jgi:hypothetical protein